MTSRSVAREVVAEAEQRLPREVGDGVGQAVAEVQRRRMPALAEAFEGVDGDDPVAVVEREHSEVELGHESANRLSAGRPDPRA